MAIRPPIPIPGTDEVGSIDDAVVAAVRMIPPGRVMTYGDVAEFVGGLSPRTIGRVLAGSSDLVSDDEEELPWHRVVQAGGTCAPHIRAEQLHRLRADGVPIRNDRVDLRIVRWDGRVVNLPGEPGQSGQFDSRLAQSVKP